MHMRNFLLAIALLALPLFQNSCAPPPPAVPEFPPVEGSDSRELADAWEKAATEGLTTVPTAPKGAIPVVVFRNPGNGFGSVDWETSPSGSYRSFQGKGTSGEKMALRVIGAPGKGPVLIDAPSVFTMAPPGQSGEATREWKTVKVPGFKRNVRYHLLDHAAGDTNEQWVTDVFTIRSPDGTVSSYQAVVEVTDSGQAPVLFSKLGVK